jgi:hypothetical protein
MGNYKIEEDMEMNAKRSVIIFSAKLARKLLKKGYTMVDIKPDRTDSDGKRGVFVFCNENGIMDEMKDCN